MFRSSDFIFHSLGDEADRVFIMISKVFLDPRGIMLVSFAYSCSVCLCVCVRESNEYSLLTCTLDFLC